MSTDPFERSRRRLIGLAYRMLGSMTEAEDVVQDTWLRWNALGNGQDEVERPEAWLTTACTRLALDRLKSAHRTRTEYVGPWLPEPLATSPDPVEAAELADSLTFGFLTVLERLEPVERAVLLLADVFDVPFDEVGLAVGRSPATCRQIAFRARQRVRDGHRVVDPDAATRTDLVEAFLLACALGDVDGLRRVLAADVVLVSDGGAERRAARRPVIGIDRVGRLLLNLAKRLPAGSWPTITLINGEPGFVTVDGAGKVDFAMCCEVIGGVISEVRIIVSPTKLRAFSPKDLRSAE
jgi:RNA polymerase sigma-70 factor, ECF subfamily